MSGPYRVYIWGMALFGAALPFITLYFFLPNEILDNTSYVPIPNKLITDYAFIGVAIFLACIPDWLCDEHFRSFKPTRRHTIVVFRSAATLFAVFSFFHYLRIELQENKVFDNRFSFNNLDEGKLSLMWCVIAVVMTSLAAIVVHLGRAAEARGGTA